MLPDHSPDGSDRTGHTILAGMFPITYIDANTVPVLFAYGSLDGVVPPKSRNALEDQLDKFGIPYYSIIMEHSGHNLAFDLDKHSEFLRMADEYCRMYFQDCRSFF